MEREMGFKRITMLDIFEILRRWHNKQSISHISRMLDYDRKTVRKIIDTAKAKGITHDEPLPSKQCVSELLQDVVTANNRPALAQQILSSYLDEVTNLINDKHNPLKPKMAFEVICERHDLTISYSSYKRFVRTYQIPLSPHTSTCRIEVIPGSEVQVDYAKMGLLYEPLTQMNRTVYAFIATLSNSRHKYVEFVFKQDQRSFVASHIKMFEAFDGVPLRILLDNLKSGVIKPDLYDPSLNRTYLEMAEHYGCFIDPCRVRHPKDKGKVERDVQTIRDQFRKLKALHPQLDVQQANHAINKWICDVYGQRKHGSTNQKPYDVFIEKERPQLQSLPNEPFVIAQWKQATVHPDHYIQFNKQFYSVPHAYVGKIVWVRATDKCVEIYFDNNLIKQHVITNHLRHTDYSDFPENIKAALDDGLPYKLQQKAMHIGPSFNQLIRAVLKPHAFVNLRKAQALLALKNKWSYSLLEQAAAITLEQQIRITPDNFKRLLEKLSKAQHDKTTDQPPTLSQQTMEFLRDISYFIKSEQENI
jgi:transposase